MEDKTFGLLDNVTADRVIAGYYALLQGAGLAADSEHLAETPLRAAHAMDELMRGLNEDPTRYLQVQFAEEHYDQMVHIANIEFVSLCEHHLLPFHGKAHFAYVPDKSIVGLSKVPRMLEALACRPQTQERLTEQIVSTFQDVVKPKGCAVMVRAWHSCVAIRGVRQANCYMLTTALRGVFTKPDVKAEFLNSAHFHTTER